VRGYRAILDRRIIPKWGDTPLRKVRAVDLDRWYGELRSRGGPRSTPLAANTVMRVHAVLHRALGQGVRWGWLTTNPADHATPGRPKRNEIAPPSPDAVVMLIEKAGTVNPALPVFLRLAAGTGARRGELCALRWENVDFEGRQLVIDRALVEIGGDVIEKDTKTHAARRVGLDTGTLEMLRAHRAEREDLARACGATVLPDSFLFSHEVDGSEPWRPGYVTTAFTRIRDELGLGTVRLHDLRHFTATRLLAAGKDIRTVSGRLGHANAATTLGVYAHFLQASDHDAADAIGALLDGETIGVTGHQTPQSSRTPGG
jgi:integrase